ncbi:hypothetical protein MLD38_014338 [Melastoma candidum]|uniref:Uncharacterized protein n=1 Tax=Melastoma candidum TaxID=119954 RepID=A0ACB9RDS3_9MYRT|nr:hypothetical protein MLD38_014338 [Melastoma candidum]
MIGDVYKMIAVGLIWGTTNALIRRGTILWSQSHGSSAASSADGGTLRRKLVGSVKNCLDLLLFWQYSVPFLVNLSASVAFFALLRDAPISLAVPITNATTFAATAVAGVALGEEVMIGRMFLGTCIVIFGVWLCVV